MDDLISRQDAIDAVQKHFNDFGFVGYQDGQKMMDRIKDLPTAEPVIRCKDCKHYHHYHTFANGVSVTWCDFGYSREIDISDCWYCADAERRSDETDHRKE